MSASPSAPRRHRLHSLLMAGTLLGSAFASGALAQTGWFQPIGRLVVTSDTETGDSGFEGVVAERSGSGARTDTPITEVPQSVSVIGREEIRQRGATSVTEALRYTPGVLSTARPSSRYDIGGLRGFGGASGQSWFDYLDGMRMLRGGYNAPIMDPWNIERVEVLRGPASVLFGGNMPGGVVNQSTKRPQPNASREVELRFGSPRRAGLAFDVNQPLREDGTLLFRVTGLVSRTDGNVDFSRSRRQMLAPSLSWRPSEDTELTIQAGILNDPESFYAVYLPTLGTLEPHPSGHQIPYDFNIEDPNYSGFERRQNWLGYEFRHDFNSSIRFVHSLRYMEIDSDQWGMTPWPTAAMTWPDPTLPIISRTAARVSDRSEALTADARLEARFATGAVSHTLLAGLDYQSLDTQRMIATGFAGGTIDYTNPVYGFTLDPDFITRMDEQRRQLGVYLQNQARIGDLTVTAGLRHDSYEADLLTTVLATGASRATRVDHSATTWRLGATYDFGNGFIPFANISSSFEPQVSSTTGVDAAGNLTDFEPTTGEQFEIGLRYQPQGFRGLVSLSYFDIRQENLAMSSGIANPGCTTPLNCQIQTGEVRSRGIELEVKAEVLPGFDVIASYSYTDAEVVQGATPGMRPTAMPEVQAALWGHYTFDNGLGLGAGLRHVGSTYADTANTLTVPSFTLADLSLSYDFGRANPQYDGLRLTVAVSNLFDREYLASCPLAGAGLTGYCYWGEGRVINAALNYRW